jgi:beta-mannosidase
LVAGRFGTAFDAANAAAQSVAPSTAFTRVPMTVELWCKLNSSDEFNILASCEPKESPDHWEVYTESGSGTLSAYLPGMTPAIIKSPAPIADRKWHYVAMVVDEKHLSLFVDGNEVIKSAVRKNGSGKVFAGVLRVGKTVWSDGSFTCDGAIDELRLSNIARKIRGAPTAAFTADEHVVGLWNFEREKVGAEFIEPLAGTSRLSIDRYLSMSETDRASYHAGPSPLDSPAETVPMQPGRIETPTLPPAVSLDGEWQLAEGGADSQRLTHDWDKPIPATVPGSIHTALARAGVIPHPYLARNQEIARRWSFKTYWYKRVFPRPPVGSDRTLVFHGIANRATIWLNGKKLARHEGMFTSIELPVADLLQDSNTLIVKLDPAIDWQKTVVFNNSYGWHYSKFPPLGIWQPVELRGESPVKLQSPYVATCDTATGLIDLIAELTGPKSGCSGKLIGVISPENFTGEACHFEYPIHCDTALEKIHIQLKVPKPRLWWPVDLGSPNLYRLKLLFQPEAGQETDVHELTFGIRTIRMAPVAGRARPTQFDWTFIVNGRPIFVKGTGWCTCDAMMDFSRARYDRLLSLAASQHIQMLRAWGAGMVETNDFYDLCDRKAIMVMQEWPTAWNSHTTQPYGLLENTVREGTLRLRNHPSLAIYTGGNESDQPFGRAIDMMGRLNVELDGERDFHRGEPFGGSQHDYYIYWGAGPIDHAFTMQAVFYGEFGLASYPNYESALRFLPRDERSLWPPPFDKSFAYHTPIFNTAHDLDHLTRLSRYFSAGDSMESFIVGTQLAQAVGVRHALERARARWPNCTGALYYKLNDNSPAATWSTVDWYGAPKLSHYFIQRSFAPLVAVALFPKATVHEEPLSAPIVLLDDADTLRGVPWTAIVRAFDADLKQLKETSFSGNGSIKQVKRLGDFTLTADETKTTPLFIVTDVRRNDVLSQRNYYFINFAGAPDCLFNLPKTELEMKTHNGEVTVKNTGKMPAVGVEIARPGHLDTFSADENYFWLSPGETKVVRVNDTANVTVKAWNSTSP